MAKFKVGDVIECINTARFMNITLGGKYVVINVWGCLGEHPIIVDDEGNEASMCSSRFKLSTKTEAERRGAKFGVMGVSKITGRKIRFVTDDGKKSLNGQPLWVFLNEETQSIMRIRPSEVRFDHEPEFVAWSEAPEHLRYDASRVYYDGEPVKWIVKPEGSVFDVVATVFDGSLEFSGKNLTVKL